MSHACQSFSVSQIHQLHVYIYVHVSTCLGKCKLETGITKFIPSSSRRYAISYLIKDRKNKIMVGPFIPGKGHIIARGCPCLTQSHKNRIQERVSQKEFLKESEVNPITRYSVWRILKRASLLHQGYCNAIAVRARTNKRGVVTNLGSAWFPRKGMQGLRKFCGFSSAKESPSSSTASSRCTSSSDSELVS